MKSVGVIMGAKETHGPTIGDLKRPLSFIFAVLLFIAIFVGSLVLVVVVYEEQPVSLERDLVIILLQTIFIPSGVGGYIIKTYQGLKAPKK